MAKSSRSYRSIMGKIGAAKQFSSSVAPSLDIVVNKLIGKSDNAWDEFMDSQGDNEEVKAFKKLKRLRSYTNMANAVNRVNEKANDLLMNLLEKCDFVESEIIEFVAKFLVNKLPVLETTVKGVLLANLKGMINCAVDPRIPDYLRDEGITVNERYIDPRGVLSSSPFSRLGRYNYFGVTERTKSGWKQTFNSTVSLYSLARAEDMNAFFWFTKNCARFVSPTVCADASQIFDTNGETEVDFTDYTIYSQKNGNFFQPGCVFKRSTNDNVLFLCTSMSGTGQTTKYEIHETSSDFESCNWYAKPSDLYGIKLSSNENPIFNLKYGANYDARYRVPYGNYNFKILPKPYMLPAGIIGDLTNSVNVMSDIVGMSVSAVTGSKVTKENWNSAWKNFKFPGVLNMPAKKATFDAKGNFDKNGIFSIDESKYDVIETSSDAEDKKLFILKPRKEAYPSGIYMYFDMSTNVFELVDTNNPPYGIVNTEKLSQVLRECYCKNTVYEFNYDYLNSFRLFDAKVVAANLINSILNIDYRNFKSDEVGDNNGVVQDMQQLYINSYVDKLVERIIDEQDSDVGEFKGCFYEFDNEDYIELERETIKKLYSGTLFTGIDGDAAAPYDDVYETLSNYDTSAKLQEGISEAIQNAIKWSPNVKMEYHEASAITIGSDYSLYEGEAVDENASDTFTKIIKFLTAELVNAFLSPKVLMLIRVNMEIMQSDPTQFEEYKFNSSDYDWDSVFKSVLTHITSAIKEIIDTVQKELLSIILARISEILSAYVSEICLEQARRWAALLKSLLLKYKYYKGMANLGVNLLGSIMDGLGSGDSIESSTSRKSQISQDAISFAIDQVDYADIDALVGEIINSKEC